VDPVNAEAVRNKKADADELDVYALDLESGRATRLVSGVLAAKRALTWTVGGGRLALLRKHRGFDRGGMELEVYDLRR
jgi:hypothetical protein